MAVGIPAPENTPASCPAPVGSTGAPAEDTDEAVPQRRLEVHHRRHGFGDHLDRGAVPLGALGGQPGDPRQQRLQGRLVGGAGIQPGHHHRRYGVGPVRLDREATEGGPGTRQPGLLVGGQRRHRVRQHRVVPVLHRGGAGVVRLPGEGEAEPTVRPDRRGHADRGALVHERPALFDVELDEGRHPVGQRRRADAGRVGPGRRQGGPQRDAGPVRQREGRVGGERADRHARAETGHPEPGPLLLDERGHADGDRRLEAVGPQQVDRGER
jgi:hypothetical protein